ncbi:MAG: cysteine synthase family protein [Oscillospiraceae bacterium]|nr:cysteine synthase family protein [Oscillospiraceae bacterium]
MVYRNILDALGNTPLIHLSTMTGPDDARILAKFEGLNVGGSIKTRTAYRMIEAAEAQGLLSPDSIIVEPTSGNQGIGLALVGAVKGYKVIIIMPDSVSAERRLLITQYGAELRLIHDDGDIGKAIDDCIATANAMAESDPRVFMPNQFTNPENLQAHIQGTALEILDQIDGPIHGFCSGVGTGGTLTGIGAVLKKKFPDLWICCAEPEHAAILSGGNIGTHVQMGIGDGLIPDILDTELYHNINIVTDEEAISTTQALAKQAGILCGLSSGPNVCTAMKMAKKLGKGKTVVTILPDTGERYFSTPLFQQGWREK